MPRNLSEQEKRALEIIKSSKDGVLQSDLWKMLGLDSREGSRLVLRLTKKGLIKREQVSVNGRRTYKLTAVEVVEDSITVKINIASILDIPCATCPYINSCARGNFHDPATCPFLDAWLERVRRGRGESIRIVRGPIGS